MDLPETMRELESLGSEPTRKTFLRHGAPEPLFGVKFGDLEKLRKRIKTDAGLAEALWETGHSDARMLATMVADAAVMSWERLDAWAQALNWHSLVDVFVNNVALRSAHFKQAVETWTARSTEMQARAGWQLLAALATKTQHLTDDELAVWLPRLEQGIHSAQNRVREAMNTALIAIGGRGGPVGDAALEVAKRIGKVEVDHGDTACETPDAVQSIQKMRARKEGGVAKAAAVAKGAVDSVKDLAAKAQDVASSGAMSAVDSVKDLAAKAQDVASGAVSAVVHAKDVVAEAVSKVAKRARKVPEAARGAAKKARAKVSSVARKAPAPAKKALARKATRVTGTTPKAKKAAAKRGGTTTAKKATAKRGASSAARRTTVKPAAAAPKKTTVKRAAPAPKRATAKKAAPARSRTGARSRARS
ncbi:DNA alkylation repair protein [Pyxidicoccus parkwayensis]|uniref:DNA alkylation repair protein n=1 Tax=Pyxidicoccus parkwayensis TaxID=2813578 RepID=A0ABX7P219_9BACT|nr:DNA alkylation repair protein [Pyxidicoccus parkwaysis]QSQ22943.1 DNA alkylation repair protein [Pyxidicoccus parkwaysis]